MSQFEPVMMIEPVQKPVVKMGRSNYQIDLKNKRITFLDSRFYLTASGKFVPSVTTILDAYPKPAHFYSWLKEVGSNADDIRDEAGRRGSAVHKMTEDFDRGFEVSMLTDDGELACKLGDWAMFERYAEFTERFKPEVHNIELNMVSEKLGYAGTLDRIITLNGRRILLDIKTSNSIYAHFWLQLSAYEQLALEEKLPAFDAVGILWLNAKTKTDGKKGDIQGKGWQLLLREDRKQDYKLFQHTHQLWLAENEGMQPRQTSYQLSHKINH